ncbi:unnamed protein product [Linum tenue]|uniref:60S ribosomal protein L18a-like protein n=1 Tax=Linum tenue TaxID=586396 RepID=A0AAV0M3H4_9ROSI|nr:unnamed protein product [Linum tenue]
MVEANSNNNLGYGGQNTQPPNNQQFALFVEPSAPPNSNNIPPPSQPQPPACNTNQCGGGDYGSPAAGYPYPPPQQHQSSNVTANVYMTSVAGIPVQSTTTTEVYAVVDQRPPELPCCGIGLGWLLFILGFFFAVPWYIGAGALVCSKYDKREKPGYIACAVLSVIFIILVIISASRPAYAY